MSLGWLNLQEYLGANQGSADEMAQRLDAQQSELDSQASSAAGRGDSVSYGQFLARRRQMAAQRADESGRAEMVGGDAGDALLAQRGKSNYVARPMASVEDVRRSAEARRQQESDYWMKQAERNKGLTAERDAARKAQDERFAAAKKAMEERAGGPGYRAYSNAVARSYDKSRGKQVRVISDEENDRWTR